MRLYRKGIENHFYKIARYPYLCKGCGLCAGICTQNAITMHRNEYQEYVPLFDTNKCVACGQCLSACIGRSTRPLSSFSPLGNYRKLYLGHSVDNAIRSKGSSGGVITALISWGLKVGFFPQAMVLGYENDSISPTPIYTKDSWHVLNNNGSKYISYPLCDQLKKIREHTAITALPCYASALRNVLENKVFLFGLFCSKRVTIDILKYICHQENCDFNHIYDLEFRAGEWPGRFQFKTPKKKICIGYYKTYFAAVFNCYFYSPSGCLFCNDYFCDAADISFGDPWMKSYAHKGTGDTVIIVRSKHGEDFIKKAINKNIIDVQNISAQEIITGHIKGIYNKRVGMQNRRSILLKFKMPVPEGSHEEIVKSKYLGLFLELFYIFNNFAIRRLGLYNLILKIPRRLMFIYYFSYALLIKCYLKIIKFY
ncbi:MAG: Coenzyme F420 hydrogenase/dehydrogenase, beta subunit C-terminal domain [bacterium]